MVSIGGKAKPSVSLKKPKKKPVDLKWTDKIMDAIRKELESKGRKYF